MNSYQRTKVIAGNWKMNKCKNKALEFVKKINLQVPNKNQVETIIFPPATLLDILVQNQGSNLKIGAQNMFYKTEGAFTGEISCLDLLSLGVQHVLLGHSERRGLFQETNQLINLKLLTALKYNLFPILCIGESLAIKEANTTQLFLKQQLSEALKEIPANYLTKVIIAYEPIWAIGTGKSATPEDANTIIQHIRNQIALLYSFQIAKSVRILYGGSVSVNNIQSILFQKDIDGVLAGKTALQTKDFLFLTQTAYNQFLSNNSNGCDKNDCSFCC